VYTQELVAALGATFPEDRLELYGHRLRRPAGTADTKLPVNARLHRSRVPAGALNLAARAGLGADVLLADAEVVHWTDYVALKTRHAPVVATVHDVCFVDLPACYTAEQRRALEAMVRTVTAEAARIIVPCTRVRADLQRHFDVRGERIDVVAHGCRPLPAVPAATDLGRYVLFVGTLQPRKNVERLVLAFDAVHAAYPDVRLVLAGPRGWNDAALLDAIVQRTHVRHEPVADAARLSALYRGAIAVAQPSLGEGFGLPILEAMHCGRAVLVGADTACSDLADDAGLAVDPLDTDAITAGLKRLLDDDVLCAELGARGRARAAAFTWARAARATRAVYERAVRA
jgi:glycosyltransferase involved in cell wall biosynthesis